MVPGRRHLSWTGIWGLTWAPAHPAAPYFSKTYHFRIHFELGSTICLPWRLLFSELDGHFAATACI
jgi:hypothetical protein